MKYFFPKASSIKTYKRKKWGQFSAILTEKSLVFSCQTKRAIPSAKDKSTLLAWVANQNTGFAVTTIEHDNCSLLPRLKQLKFL